MPSHCWITITTIQLQNFYSIPNRNSVPIKWLPPFPNPASPWQPLFVSGFSLSIVFSRFIHVVACVRASFLKLNNIPLSVYSTLCLSSHLLVDFWVVHLWNLWIMLLFPSCLLCYYCHTINFYIHGINPTVHCYYFCLNSQLSFKGIWIEKYHLFTNAVISSVLNPFV